MSNILNTVENTASRLWNSTEPPYPTETLAPQECMTNLETKVDVFWDVVIAVAVLFVATLLLPVVLFCCRNRPRCMATVFNVMAVLNGIIGILLATILMPQCPLECGATVCDQHKYNPGPIYGILVLIVCVLWFCKACSLKRYAKRMEVEAEATKAENGSDPVVNNGKEIV